MADLLSKLNNETTPETNEQSNKPQTKPTLSPEDTIDLKAWLKNNMPEVSSLLKGSFESAGKTINYGIIPVQTEIPSNFIGFKPMFGIYLKDEQGKIIARVSSISFSTINVTFIQFEELKGSFSWV